MDIFIFGLQKGMSFFGLLYLIFLWNNHDSIKTTVITTGYYKTFMIGFHSYNVAISIPLPVYISHTNDPPLFFFLRITFGNLEW